MVGIFTEAPTPCAGRNTVNISISNIKSFQNILLFQYGKYTELINFVDWIVLKMKSVENKPK